MGTSNAGLTVIYDQHWMITVYFFAFSTKFERRSRLMGDFVSNGTSKDAINAFAS